MTEASFYRILTIRRSIDRILSKLFANVREKLSKHRGGADIFIFGPQDFDKFGILSKVKLLFIIFQMREKNPHNPSCVAHEPDSN